ncbi:MAG: DUF349 domain-containing protein, partial [Bacteroidetes bacterium]
MAKTKHTDQNPDPEHDPVQEENSSSVPVTEPSTEHPVTDPESSETTEEQPIQPEAAEPDPPMEIIMTEEAEEQTGDKAAEQKEEEEEGDDNDHQESEEDFNQYTREQLLEHLEAAVNEPDLNQIKTRIALIKMAFLKKREELHEPRDPDDESEDVPSDKPEHDELDIRFDTLFSVYKANKSRFVEEQEKLKRENLERKNQILEELRNLISSEETLKKTYDEFKTLQDRWKEIGMVPRSEINNLWQNYHFLVEKFFEKVKLNKELKDLDLKKNLEAKIELCEKTEELLLEPSILKSFKQLQKYHEDWKEIGPVPSDKKDEIWERFKNATDKINERRREYYASIEEEQKKNLETKQALCQQAEELLSNRNETVKDWQTNTQQINELLKIWKSVGPVPQKFNTEIWARFKGCLDNFFTGKKEYFDRVKEQQMHNYNLKVDLCVQAEAIKTSIDWKKTTNDLIRLQGEWKRIGPVPRKHSDKIWKRFRAACDQFFEAKTDYFANIHSHEDENLKSKEALLENLKNHQFGEDKSQNLEELKT